MASRKDVRSDTASDFCVGGWHAQPALNLIRDGGTERHLEPQVTDLLAFLAVTEGRVVSKSEIIDAVWEGRFIANATLTRAIADLRRALGDNQRSPQYIETIPKRGYRLVAPVTAAGRHAVSSVADRLASARRSRFVGRETELEIFRSALLAGESPFVALHVYGPGGVGKTTLLQEFARVAAEAGRAVVRIDGRNIDPSPAGFLFALSQALGVDRTDASGVAGQWPAAGVLFVDTYELLEPLDEWLRHTLLPQLPARSLVVSAGRNEPATAWRADVAWTSLTRITPLGNLRPQESRTYLTKIGAGRASRRSPRVHARTSAGVVARRRCADARRPARAVTPGQRARDRAPATRDLRAGHPHSGPSSRAARVRDGVGDDRAAPRLGPRTARCARPLRMAWTAVVPSSTARTDSSRTISRATWCTEISAGGTPTPRRA